MVVVLGIVLLAILFFVVRIYNELVKERILVHESQSSLGAYLQQRLDLIPNLVETVKGYASHEKEILKEIAMWHSKGIAAVGAKEQGEVAIGLSSALRNVFAISQNYPELKADTNFKDLYDSLNDIEESIRDARRYFNGTVREYNQSIAVFPKVLIAGMFGFKPEVFFVEDPEAKKVPKVNFTDK
ncbi:MAG: LemA family protein [Bacteroidota bacterium]|jgi:LemA protein